jgi:CubicO group peptidase (beta-lactamase class C family)
MTTNHLPPELMPFEIGGVYSPGYGYGLGVDVLMDVGQCQRVGSEGAYSWGGAAATSFWVDPKEELIGILMAQFQPSGFHLIADDFKVAAYQSIVD